MGRLRFLAFRSTQEGNNNNGDGKKADECGRKEDGGCCFRILIPAYRIRLVGAIDRDSHVLRDNTGISWEQVIVALRIDCSKEL